MKTIIIRLPDVEAAMPAFEQKTSLKIEDISGHIVERIRVERNWSRQKSRTFLALAD